MTLKPAETSKPGFSAGAEADILVILLSEHQKAEFVTGVCICSCLDTVFIYVKYNIQLNTDYSHL